MAGCRQTCPRGPDGLRRASATWKRIGLSNDRAESPGPVDRRAQTQPGQPEGMAHPTTGAAGMAGGPTQRAGMAHPCTAADHADANWVEPVAQPRIDSTCPRGPRGRLPNVYAGGDTEHRTHREVPKPRRVVDSQEQPRFARQSSTAPLGVLFETCPDDARPSVGKRRHVPKATGHPQEGRAARPRVPGRSN